MLGVKAVEYNSIPYTYIEFYSHFRYVDLIRPLLTIERNEGASYGQLAIKYGVTKRTVEYHFCCSSRYLAEESEEE